MVFAEVSDSDLVRGVKQGKGEAFAELVDRYEQTMFRFLQCFSRSAVQIEDLLAEVFMRLHDTLRSTGREFEGRSFPNFVYKVALEVVDEKAQEGLLVRAAARSEMGVESSDEQRFKELLLNAISRLPLEYKQIFWLRDVTGAGLIDICEVLDISLMQLKTRLHRARLLLRRHLATQLDELRKSGVTLKLDLQANEVQNSIF